MEHRILIVGDVQATSEASLDHLLPAEAGFRCEHIPWDVAGVHKIKSCAAQLIVALANQDRASALSMLDWLRKSSLPAPILAVLPERPDEELMHRASQAADDFIVWPVREGEFRQRVERMLNVRSQDWQSVCQRLSKEIGLGQLVGNDPLLTGVIEKLPFIAACDMPVLIVGETGTGKELCAHAVHHLSKRANFPFIPVECGAVPDLLAENELFGHARGAYTDAHHDQKGVAALAENGTLFLDEIDALSLTSQAKLLRFLQDGTYRALGAERFTRVNVRVIAATNRDLESLIRQKEFRPDLYFRLNVLQVRLPSLRERRGDIPLLARYFLDSLSIGNNGVRKCFSLGALSLLEQYDWPGNVRELRNVVQRAMVFSSGAWILPHHIAISGSPHISTPAVTTFRQARQQTIEQFERLYVEETMRKHSGNITRAALAAGKDRRAFSRLVKKYGVDPRAI